MRQSVLFDARPLRSPVAGDIHSAPGTTTKLGPGMHFQLPHPGKEHAGIVGIHGKARASDVLSRKKHTFPMLAAVKGSEHAAFLLRSSRATKRTSENDIGIRGADDNSANPPSLLQPHIRPCLTRIGGLIDSISYDVAIADDPSLAGSSPHHTGIRRSDGKRPNGRNRLLVKNGRPAVAAVGRFPNSSRGSSGIVGAGIPRHSSDGRDAVSHPRPNKAKSKLAVLLCVRLLRGRRRTPTQNRQQCETNLSASDERHENLQQQRYGHTWCRRRESNPRPRDYETLALPLSYAGTETVLNATESVANVSSIPAEASVLVSHILAARNPEWNARSPKFCSHFLLPFFPDKCLPKC